MPRFSSSAKHAILWAVFALVTGCDLLSPKVDPIAMSIQRFEATSYVLFTMLNVSADPVYLPRCGEHIVREIEIRHGSDWVNVGAAACVDNVQPPARLDIRAARTDSVAITASGTYRLRVTVMVKSPSAASTLVTSPTFTIQ